MISTEHEDMHTSSSPPIFGHPMRKLFAFGPDYINLNHGSYGSLPLPVQAKCEELAEKIERNPDKFMAIDLQPMLEDARVKLSKFLHTAPDEVVLVPNASHGLK
jgi:hercynylcysteine S-oxide lyase